MTQSQKLIGHLLASMIVLLLSLATQAGTAAKAEVVPTPAASSILARDQIEPFIDYFPHDTETLVVLREKYTITAKQPATELGGDFGAYAREKLLDTVFDTQTIRNTLRGKTVKLWIEGASRFRFSGIKGARSLINDGCVLLVFDQEIGDSAKTLFLEMRPRGAKQSDMHGFSVMEYIPLRLKRDPHGFSYWITSPKPDVLLIATNPEFLGVMLQKIAIPDKAAFPATLSKWHHIDATATTWGLREYRAREYLDISDARWREGNHDPAVATSTGFSFQYKEKENCMEIVWLGCDDGMVEKLRSSIRHRVSGDEVECSVQSEGNGVLRIKVSWPDAKNVGRTEEGRRMRAGIEAWLWWYLGHAGIL